MTSRTDQEIADIFRRIAFLPAQAPVDPDAALADLERWDSICQVELIVRVEERFAIVLTEEDVRDCHTLGALAGLVESRLGG